MERKALSLFLAFVMVFLFIPVMPVTAAADGNPDNTATSGVTFKTNSQINLNNPTNLVFTTDDHAILAGAGYDFDGIYMLNVALGSGYNMGNAGGLITYVNGVLTIPAALFSQHNGNYSLQAGSYQVEITFVKDGNPNDFITFTVDFNMSLVLDRTKDALFTFPGNYEDLAGVYLNNVQLGQTDINGTSAHLSGYGEYGPDPLGRVESGSIKITLFKEFLQALVGGTYKLEIELKDGSRYSAEFEIPTMVFDSGSDAEHTFSGDYDKLDDVSIDGTTLLQTRIDDRSAHLSGYGSYNGNLGLVEKGSVKVTLYKEFLKTLPGGNYRLTVLFKDGTSGELPFIIPDQPTAPTAPTAPRTPPAPSSSGSGKVEAVVESAWLERDEAQRLASKAKVGNEQAVNTSRKGTYGVRGNAWDRLAGLRFYHDTRINGELQIRLYIDEPLKMKKDTIVSAYTTGGWVEIIKSKFEKHFVNKIEVIHFDQQADWEQSVRVAAKLDLANMDTKNLYFYAYDKNDNHYKKIKQPDYRIDKKGYLHFTTPYAGDIVISEDALRKK